MGDTRAILGFLIFDIFIIKYWYDTIRYDTIQHGSQPTEMEVFGAKSA